MSQRFLKEINSAYKNLILEQDPNMPGLGGAPTPPPPPPPAAPTPAGGAIPSMPAEEQPVEDKVARSTSDTFLIGMIAKALLVNIDDDDKLKVIKYIRNISEDSASEIEENLVNMLNSYDYQLLEDGLDKELKIPIKKSRKTLKFLENILSNYIDTEVKKD